MQEGQWQTAREILEVNRVSYKGLKDRIGFAHTLLALAQVLQVLGDLERARWTYKDALRQFAGMDEKQYALTAAYLGRLELQTNLIQDGLEHLSEAEAYFSEVNNLENLAIIRQLLEAGMQLAEQQRSDVDWHKWLLGIVSDPSSIQGMDITQP